MTLPPGIGQIRDRAVNTFLHTPIGAGPVVIDILTDFTGDEPISRCEYDLHLTAPTSPPGQPPLIQVPVQVCAIEGSDIAGSAAPGQTVRPGKLLENLATANNTIWNPQARIAFSTRLDAHIPVIPDPSPPNGSNGQLGDLEVDDAFFPQLAREKCRASWDLGFQVSLPVINARSFLRGGPTLGVSPPTSMFGVAGRAAASVVTRWIPGSESPVTVLAHELGHNLFLGHGNGLDDDGDGQLPSLPGSRRYDEICDPDWLVPPGNTDVAEDVDSPEPCSLMQVFACSTTLRPLQVETARGVAGDVAFLLGTECQTAVHCGATV